MLDVVVHEMIRRREAKKTIEGLEGKSTEAAVFSVAHAIVSLALAFYAAYLSWTCNTESGIEGAERAFYVFFAWSFGWLYLPFYYFARNGKCKKE